ncbi:MAG: DUF6152 family protein [Steroidobacteraceae bacterium]
MIFRSSVGGLIGLFLSMLFQCAVAHHSTAMFEPTKQIVLEGSIKEFRFTNPHSWIYLIVKNDRGEDVVWEIEGASVSQMARQGWTYKSLQVGEKVKVTIAPRVDGTPGGAFRGVEKSDGTVLGTSPRV